MMYSTQQLIKGLTNYMENEIAKKAVGVNKFIAYFMLPNIQNKIIPVINNLQSNELFSDYFDSNGNVDLDKVYKNAKESIQKSGQFEYMGIIFNESDVDKLYSYIKSNTV